MLDTRTGHSLSSHSAEAVVQYCHAIDFILGSESGAAEALDQALQLDKNFAMAAAARYAVAKDTGALDAQTFRERAEQTALNATEWEREHITILIGLIDQPNATRAKAFAYIADNPTDLLIISQLAGYLFFYDGPNKLQSVLDLWESVNHALSDDWAFLARLGFAASEAGQRQRGRELLERALTMRPQSLYTIHGLAHLLHDDGAAEESATLLKDWLKTHESTACKGQMYGHVQWHLALSEWQVGDRQAAIERYVRYCAPETTTCGPILTLADCGGFLLRDYLQTGEPSALNDDVLNHIERVWSMLGHPFVALHVAGLFASAGDHEGLQRCEDALLTKPRGSNRDVSLALVSSLKEFVAGHYQPAAQTLSTLSPDARIGIGGSNVERILVDLIEARSNALI